MTPHKLGWTLGAVLAAAIATACLSSRNGPTENTTGQCSIPLTASVPGSTIVVIQNFAFSPAEVHVKAGASITWVNCDGSGQPSHTSTADQGAWTSGLLASGEAFTRSFPTAGQFTYHCEPHPFMTAKVVVE